SWQSYHLHGSLLYKMQEHKFQEALLPPIKIPYENNFVVYAFYTDQSKDNTVFLLLRYKINQKILQSVLDYTYKVLHRLQLDRLLLDPMQVMESDLNPILVKYLYNTSHTES